MLFLLLDNEEKLIKKDNEDLLNYFKIHLTSNYFYDSSPKLISFFNSTKIPKKFYKVLEEEYSEIDSLMNKQEGKSKIEKNPERFVLKIKGNYFYITL